MSWRALIAASGIKHATKPSINRPSTYRQVVRTSQYGCNCRGAGGNGGCGEFDIVEAVIGIDYSDMLFTTVYDDKGTGAPGHNKYFLRPSVRNGV